MSLEIRAEFYSANASLFNRSNTEDKISHAPSLVTAANVSSLFSSSVFSSSL
jgi:hypothetical protein